MHISKMLSHELHYLLVIMRKMNFFFKIFIEFVTILFLFCFGFSAARHVGS